MKKTDYPFQYIFNSLHLKFVAKNCLKKSSFLMLLCCSSYISAKAQCTLDINMTTQNISCDSGNDGTATFTAVDGQTPVTYEWTGPVSGNQTNAGLDFMLTDLGPGNYSVTITDNTACSVQGAFSITLTELEADITVNDVSCAGINDGSINLTPLNGRAPHTVIWSDGLTTFNRNNLSGGNYSATITDAGNCFLPLNLFINEPSPISLSANVTDAYCFGVTDGRISLFADGGTWPLTYDWDNGISSTQPVLNGIPAGTYTVTVTDNNGCTETLSIVVNEPPPVEFTLASIQDACQGSCTGSVQFVGSGGTPPDYYYYLSNNEFNQTGIFSDLCAGTYSIIIADSRECQIVTQFTITESSSPDIDIFADVFNPSCADDCDGQINLRVICGSGNYTYDWNIDDYDGQKDLVDLCDGTYEVTVTDSDGNSATATYVISSPDSLMMNFIINNAICFNECSAAVFADVSGGTAPYLYVWSNGTAIGPEISDLCAGNYFLTIQDANGCTLADGFNIGQPDLLTVNINASDASCQGEGMAMAEVAGGTPPYSYSWNNMVTSESIDNLEGGCYHVTVFDANGCMTTDTACIAAPFDVVLSSSSAGCGVDDGTASVTITGGISDPVYEWSNGGTGPTQTGLAVGGYSVTITDNATGCRLHENVTVELDPTCFARISGYVLEDPDEACTAISGLNPVPFIQVTLDNGMTTFTNALGYYQFDVMPGDYEIAVIVNGIQYEEICTDPISVSATDFGGDYPNNIFYVNFNGVLDLGLKVSKLTPRPGFTRTVRICVMNYGSIPMDGTLTFVHDPMQEYISTNFPPDNYDEDNQTLTYSFSNHPPGAIRVYRVSMKTPANVPIGTVLDYYFKVDPVAGDIDPANNEIYCTRTVQGSYDPNDKQVEPVGVGPEGLISLEDSLLSYQIRFQNTGTDTAFTVVVRDTLDADVDLRTLVPGPSSHPYSITVRPGRVLEFTFDNIYLPDSNVNEPASHGFLFYDINIKTRELGTRIENTAAIYFDYNAPIITNTTINTLYRPATITETNVSLCYGGEYDGVVYTQNTVLMDTLAGTFEDSIELTNIEVIPEDVVFMDLDICIGESYGGIVIFMDTTFTEVYQNAMGCDSTIVTNIDAVPENNTILSISLCEGDSYNGVSYFADTSFSEVYQNYAGCDSTVRTDIAVFEHYDLTIDTTLFSGDIYDGIAYFNDTTLMYEGQSQEGCDSLVTVNIMVNTVGVAHLPGLSSFALYPNPVSSFVQISLHLRTVTKYRLDMYNITGKNCLEGFVEQELQAGEHQLQLDLSHLPAGTYTLVFQSAEGQLSRRLVKLNH